jgi:hypothetical protein
MAPSVFWPRAVPCLAVNTLAIGRKEGMINSKDKLAVKFFEFGESLQ